LGAEPSSSGEKSLKEIEHYYPKNIHILDDPYLSHLAGLISQKQTLQPLFNQLIRDLYRHFFIEVFKTLWPLKQIQVATRMTDQHPEQRLNMTTFDPKPQAICVDMARAGMVPSQVVYDQLNQLLPPQQVRQDHIFASRVANESQRVTHTELSSSKIGGDIDQAFVFIPDPMGATGHSLCEVVKHYKEEVSGQAIQFVALHMIITPEFVRRIAVEHPDVLVYAVRLDRGLSTPQALEQPPGKLWDQEKGLNDSHYIVPGAGGVGELINNSFV
jgi:uracil phosphoribosyltransferase